MTPVESALRDMLNLNLLPSQRAAAGRRLAELGDPRPGVLASGDMPEFEWCEVPAGAFVMGGYHAALNAWNGAEVDLPYTFWIAKYPVTCAQYAVYPAANGLLQTAYWEKWRIANHPMVGITWYEAYDYATWLNRLRQNGRLHLLPNIPAEYVIRLPRECEWEKAARYPDGQLFPWGNAWEDGQRVNWNGSRIEHTSAVGAFPEGANPTHGACDLIGNVWEWCLTVWQDHYTTPEAEANYTLEEAGNHPGEDGGDPWRIIRGGSWRNDQPPILRTTARFNGIPWEGHDNLGFRLVVAPAV